MSVVMLVATFRVACAARGEACRRGAVRACARDFTARPTSRRGHALLAGAA